MIYTTTGDVHDGEWKDGLKHGQGSYFYKSSDNPSGLYIG